ncbi:FtsX-like permease family protein [Nocardioides sp. Iso805N]|uniref:FtsX-like permease family protein n=1 Tax=Nocardioides sp. Iso805N TaxID=1283287 RepID=UPI00036D79A1|nr:FtsX-like permease family protein [Nocardioides sp. Iso805N]
MLTLALRRARVQSGMLAAVVGLIAVAACLVGVCTLLLTATQQRGFHAEVERAQPADVDVTAYLVELPGSELEDARTRAQRVVADVLAPMRPTVTSSAFGPMRRLNGNRLAYLATDDEFTKRAVLTSGRWPTPTSGARPEAVVPAVAAQLLGLHLGDTVTLGQELDVTGVGRPVLVVIVGTFQPRPGPSWDTDPLSGQGYTPAWSHGTTSPPAYGPFVVSDAAFRASGSFVGGLRVTAHPTLALAQPATLMDAAQGLGRASALLTSGVGDRVQITRVASQLPQTLERIHAQQATTRSTVLVVVLLGAALSVAAALLAGWLVASRRDDERALLVALGLSRHQQLALALMEAVLLAAAAAVLAVPAAAITHASLTHLPGPRAAGLAQPPTMTPALIESVVASSLLLALALALTALDTGTATDRGARHRAGVRGSIDLLLLIVTVVCWWQLRSQPAAGGEGDVILTAAPVLFLAAVTMLAVRLVPAALGAAARVGTRSRSLILPLAAQQAARRPHTGTAMVAIAAAVAAGSFALGLHTTWERSQDDQAALLAGTDLTLVPAATAGQQATAAVETAAARGSLGSTVSPAITRPLTLGSLVGPAGVAPVIVAVDTAHAATLLRGRLDDGATWATVGARLTPSSVVHGVALPVDGAGIDIEATAPARAGLQVSTTAVLQDAAGIRSSVSADSIPMDGRTHRATWLGTIGAGQRLVGVRLGLTGPGAPTSAKVAVSLRIPGTATSAARHPWRVAPAPVDDGGLLSGTDVAVTSVGTDTVVRTTATANLTYFGYSSNTLLVTAIPSAPDVPVAVSQDLVHAVGARLGSRLAGIMNGTAITLRVAAIVPDIPSAPGQAALLADSDLLTRALVNAGDLDPGYDAWWIADPSPASVLAANQLGVGEVTTRSDVAARLATGPLRVALPIALVALVVVAVLMLLLGVGLLLASDRQRRSVEVFRLRALGMGSRDARRLLLAENTAFLLPLLVIGAVVGGVTSAALGPRLIRSEVGGTPVPAAVAAWPWGAELLLIGGSIVGALAVATALTATYVRRSGPAQQRTGEAG